MLERISSRGIALVACLLGCGGAANISRTPIDVPGHGTRDQIRAALVEHDFCFYLWTEAKLEEEYADCGLPTTPRVRHPIVGYGQPTVVVQYRPDGSFERLQRIERYRTRPEARQRFHELAAARTRRSGTPIADPREVYGPPPRYPIAWQSWFTSDGSALLSLFVIEQDRKTLVIEEILSKSSTRRSRPP